MKLIHVFVLCDLIASFVGTPVFGVDENARTKCIIGALSKLNHVDNVEQANFINHEHWKQIDTRPARFKEIDGIPDTASIHSQSDLDAYVAHVQKTDLTAPSKIKNNLGEPVYRFISSERDALAFAQSLLSHGVSSEDLFKNGKPVFKPGRAYEDIKSEKYSQLVGKSNRDANDATSRFTIHSIQTIAENERAGQTSSNDIFKTRI